MGRAACDGAPARSSFTLENGLVVELEQSPASKAWVRLEMPVGALDLPREQAHLVEHLVLDALAAGNGRIGARSLGAVTNAATKEHRTVFTAGGPPEETLRLAWLLRRGLSRADFDEDELAAGLEVLAREAEFRARNSATQYHAWAWNAVLRREYEADPIIRPLSAPQTTGEELRRIVRTRYGPEGSRLEVSSPYPPSRLKEPISAMFSDWRSESSVPPQMPVSLPGGTVRLCMEGLTGRSLVIVAASLNGSIPGREGEAIATVLTTSASERVSTAIEEDVSVEMVGVGFDDDSLAEPVWRFVATFGDDVEWKRLAHLADVIISASWAVDPDAVTQVAAETWFREAHATRCGPPPPRPDFDRIEHQPLPPPPKVHTLILVRGVDACSSTDS
ncbi:MAG: insulinase family protein [Deltaproteobacteria bacterium]|nr:MAG: insulinase family protein [Deltaproteobacteria bacterium]